MIKKRDSELPFHYRISGKTWTPTNIAFITLISIYFVVLIFTTFCVTYHFYNGVKFTNQDNKTMTSDTIANNLVANALKKICVPLLINLSLLYLLTGTILWIFFDYIEDKKLAQSTSEQFTKLHKINKNDAKSEDQNEQKAIDAIKEVRNFADFEKNPEFAEWYNIIINSNWETSAEKTKQQIYDYSEKIGGTIVSSQTNYDRLKPMQQWAILNSYISTSSLKNDNISSLKSTSTNNLFYLFNPNEVFNKVWSPKVIMGIGISFIVTSMTYVLLSHFLAPFIRRRVENIIYHDELITLIKKLTR